MLEKILEFLKDNTKATVTIIVAGIGAVTLAWSNGCSVDVNPVSPPAMTAPAKP